MTRRTGGGLMVLLLIAGCTGAALPRTSEVTLHVGGMIKILGIA